MKDATVRVSRPCTRCVWCWGGVTSAGGVHLRCCSTPARDNWHLAALSLCPFLSLFTKGRPHQFCKRLGSWVCTLTSYSARLLPWCWARGWMDSLSQPVPFDVDFLAQSLLGLLAIGLNLPMNPYCENAGRVCRSEETWKFLKEDVSNRRIFPKALANLPLLCFSEGHVQI